MKVSLVGKQVKHISFGKGTVAGVSGNVIEVQFPVGKKKFIYPDAFSKYLVLQDSKLQREMTHINEKILEQETAEREKKNAQDKKLHELRTMKLEKNSQAVFNIPAADVSKIAESGEISTGCYLSGYSKGEPRIPNKLSPNSACLITAVPDKKSEKAREILGVFMVKDDFWGEYCRDGIVKSHEKYKIFLPSGKHLSYWKYVEHSKNLPQWGNVPFRYFDTQTMQDILADMTELLAGTKQESAAKEFFRYFSAINRLPMRIFKPDSKEQELKKAAE